MRDRPTCFGCVTLIEGDIVYESPCGHEDCPSSCFHPICLMEWRDRRKEAIQRLRQMIDELLPPGSLEDDW